MELKALEKIINEYACYNDGCVKELAKAIEQYVISARIQELEKLGFEESDFSDEYYHEDEVDKVLTERIAELKKGLE